MVWEASWGRGRSSETLGGRASSQDLVRAQGGSGGLFGSLQTTEKRTTGLSGSSTLFRLGLASPAREPGHFGDDGACEFVAVADVSEVGYFESGCFEVCEEQADCPSVAAVEKEGFKIWQLGPGHGFNLYVV